MKYFTRRFNSKLESVLDKLGIEYSARVEIVSQENGKHYVGLRTDGLDKSKKAEIKKLIPKVEFFDSSKVNFSGKSCVIVARIKPSIFNLFKFKSL